MLGSSVAACPACGSPLARRRSGADTIFYPESQTSTAASGAETWAASPPAGTVLLRSDAMAAKSRRLELKLQAALIRKGGPRNGERLTVAPPATAVGRENAEIRIEDPTLSGRHFVIEEQGHEFFLRDLESTNGTYLNGHLVRSAKLKAGDEIRAGESAFVFSVLQVIPCD